MTYPSEADRALYRDFAATLAARAARQINRAQSHGFEAHLKADGSYVTNVDVEVERMLRLAIARRFPGHAIEGEEFPAAPGADFTWILDPIDGTDNFVHGIPTFGTLIALYWQDQPLVGVVAHPALKRCYSAGVGLGVFLDGAILKRPELREEKTPIVITTAPENFEKSGDFDRFCAIHRRFPNSRIYRDCFAHSRVIEGAAAAMIDANVRRWDIAATRVVIEEAGGRFVELKRWTAPDGAVYYTCAFGRPTVVDELCALMNAK